MILATKIETESEILKMKDIALEDVKKTNPTRFDLIEIIFNYDEAATLDELKGLSYDELVDYILSLDGAILCI